jgi:hypothetical protein
MCEIGILNTSNDDSYAMIYRKIWHMNNPNRNYNNNKQNTQNKNKQNNEQKDIYNNDRTYRTNTALYTIVKNMIDRKLNLDDTTNDKYFYRHSAQIFEHGKYSKRFSDGENSLRTARSGCNYGLHAEMDAIRRLPSIKKGDKENKKRINLTVVVLRINRKGMLRNSRPCSMCIKYMLLVNSRKDYNIVDISYSDANGEIVTKKLKDLALLDDYYTRHFRT